MSQPTAAQIAGTGKPTAGSPLGYRLAVRAAAVSAVFSAVVAALLMLDYGRRGAEDPLQDPQFIARKVRLAELSEMPRDEQVESKLKELETEIRRLDLELRQQYFQRRRFAETGGRLLLGGVLLFLIAARSATTLRRKIPMPGPAAPLPDTQARTGLLGRRGIATLAVLLIAAALALETGYRSLLPSSAQGLVALAGTDNPAAGPDTSPRSPLGPRPAPLARAGPRPAQLPPLEPGFPSDEQIGKMWPRFRGPGGTGVSAYAQAPSAWNGQSGEGIRWKTPVPLPGANSPVVWDKRVFLSGATEDRREVYCFDADSGKLLWQKAVPGSPQSTAKPPKVMDATGFAAPTTTTDGRRVYAIFANGDLAAFDFAGNLRWSRSLGIPDNTYGHASSLAMYHDLLLVLFDQAGPRDKRSKLLALEAATGKTAWEAKREVPNSWASPIVISHNKRDQLITCADPWVISYNPADGSELWRAKCLTGGEIGVSPAFAGGVLYVGNDGCDLSAIKPDGAGDVTKTHVLWTGEDGLPDTCSLLANKEYVFLLDSYGTLTCYDAAGGEMLWEEYDAFPDAQFTASPSLVGKRIYLFGEVELEEEDENGQRPRHCKTWIVEPDRQKVKIVAQAILDEGCVASPAFLEGRIYVRGGKHLFCIGQK